MRKILEHGKDLPCSWIGRINMAMLLKATYRFNEIPIKISMSFFKETEKSILKIRWKQKRPQIVKVFLTRKSNPRGEKTLSSTNGETGYVYV
jgi:hypothetical protein